MVPAELGYLRAATRFSLAMVRDLTPVFAATPTYADLAAHLEAAQRDGTGTWAGIGLAIARLLGEA